MKQPLPIVLHISSMASMVVTAQTAGLLRNQETVKGQQGGASAADGPDGEPPARGGSPPSRGATAVVGTLARAGSPPRGGAPAVGGGGSPVQMDRSPCGGCWRRSGIGGGRPAMMSSK